MRIVEEKLEKIELKLVVIPFNGKNPVFMECKDGLLLPIFSTKEKCIEAGFPKIAGVNYGFFIETAKRLKKKIDFRVVLDPHIVDGNTRFQLIPLDESDIQVIKES